MSKGKLVKEYFESESIKENMAENIFKDNYF